MKTEFYLHSHFYRKCKKNLCRIPFKGYNMIIVTTFKKHRDHKINRGPFRVLIIHNREQNIVIEAVMVIRANTMLHTRHHDHTATMKHTPEVVFVYMQTRPELMSPIVNLHMHQARIPMYTQPTESHILYAITVCKLIFSADLYAAYRTS